MPEAPRGERLEEGVGALAERGDDAAAGDGDAHADAGSFASDERQADGVADAGDRLQLAVGDLDVEAVLERGDELDELERVDVEVAPLGLHRRLGGAGDLQLRELLAHAGEDGLFGELLPSGCSFVGWVRWFFQRGEARGPDEAGAERDHADERAGREQAVVAAAAASASGIDAAEVLAVHSTLNETFSCGTPSASATAVTMRALAWWATK